MHGKKFSNVAAFIERSMCSARYRWERFFGITLAMHHKVDVDGAQFFDCFNECFNQFFVFWNVQITLNINMLRLGMCIQFVWKTFKFLAFSHFQMSDMLCLGMTNQFQFWECSILFWMFKSFSNFDLRGRQFCLMVCWRSWQHDIYSAGYEVEL